MKACRGVVRAGGLFPAFLLSATRMAVGRSAAPCPVFFVRASVHGKRHHCRACGRTWREAVRLRSFWSFCTRAGFPGSERRDFSAWTARRGPFSRKRACRRPCRGVCRSRLCHESSAPCRACSSAHGRTLQVPSSPPGDGRGGRKRLRPRVLEVILGLERECQAASPYGAAVFRRYDVFLQPRRWAVLRAGCRRPACSSGGAGKRRVEKSRGIYAKGFQTGRP